MYNKILSTTGYFRGLKISKWSSIRNMILRDSHMTANAFQRRSKNSNWCNIRNRFSSYNTHLTSMRICTHSLVLKSTKDMWSSFPVMFRVYVTILKYYCLSVRKKVTAILNPYLLCWKTRLWIPHKFHFPWTF